MIDHIWGGPGIEVVGGNNTLPYIGSNPNNPLMGMLRVNGSSLQAFDGGSWLNINNSASEVRLGSEAQQLLDWARLKRAEEQELEKRMASHPGLREAYEHFKIMDVLTLEEEKAKQE